MKAVITKVEKKSSLYGGNCYLITFKSDEGKSYRTWIYENCGNYKRWAKIIELGVGTVVKGLVVKGKRLIDGDSFVEIVEKVEKPIPLEKLKPNWKVLKIKSLLFDDYFYIVREKLNRHFSYPIYTLREVKTIVKIFSKEELISYHKIKKEFNGEFLQGGKNGN